MNKGYIMRDFRMFDRPIKNVDTVVAIGGTSMYGHPTVIVVSPPTKTVGVLITSTGITPEPDPQPKPPSPEPEPEPKPLMAALPNKIVTKKGNKTNE